VGVAEFSLRRAVAHDADAVTRVWLRSFEAALPGVRRAHSAEQVREWVGEVLVPQRETWVAVVGGAVVGVMALDGGWLDQLYLDPGWRGRGLGDRFVELAKRRRPAGLQLWTFQVNGPARRFYQRHGFEAVEWTDGAGNEEHEPDVRYRWRHAATGPARVDPAAGQDTN
jgi:GNAT superfamily N-acetyltransferase